MNKCDLIYNEIKNIAKKSNIDLYDIQLGRGIDCGELCIDYSNEEGYILYSYDRNLETYHYSTKDINEFKYVVFEHLCSQEGFHYELSQRKNNDCFPNDDLESDTRKKAFEYSLYLLNKINSIWMEKSIPKYEELLNKWRKNKNVFFNRQNMKFETKQFVKATMK